MQNINKVIDDLKVRLYLATQVKARQEQTLEIGGFTATIESQDGFHVKGIVELARLINVPIQTATIQGDEIRPYMAYIELYDERFYDFIGVDEFMRLERRD